MDNKSSPRYEQNEVSCRQKEFDKLARSSESLQGLFVELEGIVSDQDHSFIKIEEQFRDCAMETEQANVELANAIRNKLKQRKIKWCMAVGSVVAICVVTVVLSIALSYAK